MPEIARQAITIDPDLYSIWGDLDEETFSALKTEIQADGIRDSLILWKQEGKNILIDGHNRLNAAQQLHMNAIPVVWKEFADKAEAAQWIVSHQSARRNMTDWQKYKAAEVYQKILREKAKESQGTRTDLWENSPKSNPEENRVRSKTAKAAGLTEWKVRQGDYVREHATEKQKEELDSGAKDLKEVYKETIRENTPKKADRLKQAEQWAEATKPEDGKVADIQKIRMHKQAEQNLLEEKASAVYDTVYNIIREARKLTDEAIDLYQEVYSQKDNQKFLIDAKSMWDAGQKLIRLGEWTREVNSEGTN